MNVELARIRINVVPMEDGTDTDCKVIAIVRYDNGDYLYFDLPEIDSSAGECIAFPGDRDYYTTRAAAIAAAIAHYSA